jgi:hypothetical protein
MYRVLSEDAVALCRRENFSVERRQYELAAWVKLLVPGLEATFINVGINLGSGNISMTKHHLEST